EEGHPEFVEQQVNTELRRADIQTRALGKGCLPPAGEYTADVLVKGLAAFFSETRPLGLDADAIAAKAAPILAHKTGAPAALAGRAGRISAPAAPSGRCSPPSSSPSASSGRPTSAPTSAVIRSRPCRRSASATPSSATACRSPAPPRLRPTSRGGRSP